MHLIFDLRKASESGAKQHPQLVMKSLGISYQYDTPQSLGDCWWYWNCENVPNPLPPYLSQLNADPMNCIGFGLSQEVAEEIRDWRPEMKWISVKDRLPEPDKWVMVFAPRMRKKIDVYEYYSISNGECEWSNGACRAYQPTHWIPLPEPPKQAT